jgi:hypothetical protein
MDLESHIDQIIEHCNNDHELFVSKAFGDGGIDPLFPRLGRAAMNQPSDGEATLSRYGIWANTVRDNIIEAMDLLNAGEDREAKRHLRRSVNALSAFAEIQALFDPMGMGRPTIEVDRRDPNL